MVGESMKGESILYIITISIYTPFLSLFLFLFLLASQQPAHPTNPSRHTHYTPPLHLPILIQQPTLTIPPPPKCSTTPHPSQLYFLSISPLPLLSLKILLPSFVRHLGRVAKILCYGLGLGGCGGGLGVRGIVERMAGVADWKGEESRVMERRGRDDQAWGIIAYWCGGGLLVSKTLRKYGDACWARGWKHGFFSDPFHNITWMGWGEDRLNVWRILKEKLSWWFAEKETWSRAENERLFSIKIKNGPAVLRQKIALQNGRGTVKIRLPPCHLEG